VWLALIVWLPLTAWLLRTQWRSAHLWTGAACFAVSIFVLFFIGRAFQTTYLIWPLIGILVAMALANADDERSAARADVAGEVDGAELQPITTRP
jgi:4-amino-4-deoxy-L-arabinose transferase-like glycosyltransferase